MKIFFAYRDGYLASHRHTKSFEAESVLGWFTQNWSVLAEPHNEEESSDALRDLLGNRPYGLPVRDYEEGAELVAAPRNLKELREKLEKFTYCNEVLVSKRCVQVHTDDDEIELAWYVFDEEYARENADKISVWLHPELPQEASGSVPAEVLTSKPILPKGTGEGVLYWTASVIEDSCNLDGLDGSFRIEGVRLPGLLKYLQDAETFGERSKAPYEMQQLQEKAKLFPEHGIKQLFETMGEASDPDPASSDGTRAVVGEHIAEVSLYNGFCYSYIVLFDDIWAASHPELARSLVRFCSSWKI